MSPARERDEVVVANYSAIERLKPRRTVGGDSVAECGGAW